MTGWAAILDAAAVEYDTFRRASTEPRAAQLALLARIMTANTDTAFGRAHDFHRIDNLARFRTAVPVMRYDDIRPWVDRTASGEQRVLTSDPVVAFEETGGSTSGGKLIPYNAPAILAFRAAILPWLFGLARERPNAVAGRAYVAVSPAGRAARKTPGGIPIGVASEGAYLGPELVTAFAAVQAVPGSVASIGDIAAWRFQTLLHLVAAEDLTFISIWSPTFLTALVEATPALAEPLAKALHQGSPGSGADTTSTAIEPNPARARIVLSALAGRPIDTRALWPRLDTISTWMDGPSRGYAHRLQRMFPAVHLQPKGLLATEAPVTLPWAGSRYPAAAVTSCVLEFVDEAGDPWLCDELRAGADYRVVITTPGGLYRYDLGDLVRCHGFAGGCARLEFLGRAGVASDLVGEKLTEEFVGEVLRALDDPACLLARAAPQPRYELLVDTQDVTRLAAACERVERGLRANPQYAYARALGQLASVEARAAPGFADRIAAAQLRHGRRLGDVKPRMLIGDQLLVDDLSKPVDERTGDAASFDSERQGA